MRAAHEVRFVAKLVRSLLLVSLTSLAPIGDLQADESSASEREAPEQAALRVLDAFMAAFNARDVEAWIATLNFPHVRIASGSVAVFPDPAAFRNNFEFARFAEQTAWSRSEWGERRVVQAGPDKLHIAVVFTRSARTAACSPATNRCTS